MQLPKRHAKMVPLHVHAVRRPQGCVLAGDGIHPRKLTAGGPQNDDLDKGDFFQIWPCLVSMLDF